MLNYKSIPDARPFCCGVILAVRGSCHPTPRNPEYPTCPLSQSVLMLTFLYSCCDCGQCTSLELSALIMAIVIALAEAVGGLYFIQQWTNSRLLIKCNLVEACTLPFDYGDNIHLHCNAINHWHWIFVLVIIFYFLFSNFKECGDNIACLLLWKKQRWQREAIAIVFLILKTLWIGGKCLASC